MIKELSDSVAASWERSSPKVMATYIVAASGAIVLEVASGRVHNVGPTRVRTESQVVVNAAGWPGYRGKLKEFRGLEAGWDGAKASPPNQGALSNAQVFLACLEDANYPPTKLAPTVVGGIGVVFRRDARKTYVEFSNRGTVHALFSDGSGEPIVEKVTPLAFSYHVLIERIKAYLDEQNPAGHEEKRTTSR